MECAATNGAELRLERHFTAFTLYEITTYKGFLDRIIESLDKFFIAQVHRRLWLFLAL